MSDARDEEAWRDEMAAFEVRFPLAAFEPIAKALGKTFEAVSFNEPGVGWEDCCARKPMLSRLLLA
jgi:hypothetical protein